MQIKDLKQDKRNYRKHNQRNLDLIKKSVTEVGLGRSVVIDNENEIVCGNGLVSTLDKNTPIKVIETDGSELVVVKRTDLATNDDKRKQLAIMDNSTSESSEWDFEKLEADFDTEELEDWGLDVDFAIEEEEKEVIEDEVPEEVETRCKLGDIWQLGEHRLMCGDSTNFNQVKELLNGEQCDLLFTDPPYGVSYENKTKEVLKSKNYTKIANDDLKLDEFKEFLSDVFKNAYTSLKETASYYVFSCQGGDQEMMMMMMMRENNLPCRHQIIWVKDAPVFSMGRLDYDYKHEPILYGWVKKHNFQRKGEQDKSVWEYPRTANKLHPTMKPIELICNALKNSTVENDKVLDLFGGSGSTLIACEQLNRKCYTMELDEHYCDVIITRWENLTGKKAELIND